MLLPDTLLAGTAALPLSVPGALTLSWKFGIVAEASGLRGYSAIGFRRFFRWADIEVVGPFNLFNLPYLRLRSISSGKRLWLPLFLRGKQGFRSRVAGFAPGHSILRYL